MARMIRISATAFLSALLLVMAATYEARAAEARPREASFSDRTKPIVKVVKNAPYSAKVEGESYVDLPRVLVDLPTRAGERHAIAANLTLVMEDESNQALVRQSMPAILAQLQKGLAAYDVEHFNGPRGAQLLKSVALSSIQRAVAPELVQDVLIRHMMVQ